MSLSGMLKIKIILYNPVLHKAGNYSNACGRNWWTSVHAWDGCPPVEVDAGMTVQTLTAN